MTPSQYQVDKYQYGGNRFKAMMRDGFKCTICGMTNEEHIKKWRRGLAVHHINGKGKKYKKKDKDNRIENLQTLCYHCHQKEEIKFKNFAHGQNHYRSKISDKEVVSIRKDYKTGNYTYSQLGKLYNTTSVNAWYIVNYVTRKKVGK